MFQIGDEVVPCKVGLDLDMYESWMDYMKQHNMDSLRVVGMSGDRVHVMMSYGETTFRATAFRLLSRSAINRISRQIVRELTQ
jgi:hypothetical protein